MKIPITKPLFGSEELQAVQKPLESGWVVQGPFVKEFEEAFNDFTGSRFSIAASSCTTALHIAVAALNLKRGDEVIVPAFTWVATANVVEYMGARPVFCDINLRTFNIDVARIRELINERTVGIIPVHLFGLCADMNAILDIARENNLWIVEDAACAFGAKYEGRHAGTFGEMAAFSFHPRKSITTGEGGMITTQDERLDGLCRSLRDHGASRSDLARHEQSAAFLLAEYNHLGYNFRMTDMQGALGCAQMKRADFILAERTRRAARYDEMFSNSSWLTTPVTPAGYVHGYQSYVCLFQPEEPTLRNVARLNRQRNELMMSLESHGVSTRQGTHAAALAGYYAGKYDLRPELFPNAWLAEQLSLTLPLFAQMTDDEQSFVCESLEETLSARISA